MYFTFNIPIQIEGQWFLPRHQYEIISESMIALVDHRTHFGRFTPDRAVEKHYEIEHGGVNYIVPERAGVILDFKIPEEFLNLYLLEEKRYSDNITDYIKAAAKYLNIEVRFRPEAARWYRELLKQSEKSDLKENVGKTLKDDEVS